MKNNTKIKKIMIIMLMFILFVNISGCSVINKKENDEGKELNLYIDIEDKNTLNILKFIMDEYEKENDKVKLNINNSIGNSLIKDINKGKNDIIFVSRNKMIELSSKGLLSNLESYYQKFKLNKRYYNIVNSYGRYEDKYYGIGLIPYTIEILYNRNKLSELSIENPNNIKELEDVMKKLNAKSIKIPVVLNEDIDIYTSLISLIFSNEKNAYKIDTIYDSDISTYKKVEQIQKVFDRINNLVKSNVINRNTFEVGNEGTIKKFANGDIPVIVANSYYSYELKDEIDINILEDYSQISSIKPNIPIIINCLMCVPETKKNSESVENFIEFAFSDKIQKKLIEKGFVTGNINVNKSITGNNMSIVKHLSEGNENSILFIYNLPEKFSSNISSKVEDVLGGKYDSKEWDYILEQTYK